jgi:hypothetical protein
MANPPRAKHRAVTASSARPAGSVPWRKDGNEAIWSSLTRYHGDTYTMSWSQAAVALRRIPPVRFEYEYDFQYGALNETRQRADNLILFLHRLSPPLRAWPGR